MGYKLIPEAKEIDAAFERFVRVLQVVTDREAGKTYGGTRKEHKPQGFWAQRWFSDGRNGPRDAVALGLLDRSGSARITVRSKNPKGVKGLMVVDESGRKYVTHSGQFSGAGSAKFRQNTQGDDEWIEVEGDTRDQRYLITPLDDIKDEQILDNIARFVCKRYGVSQAEENKDGPIVIREPDAPLNQVLYGPPGTSKTYDAVSEAVKVIDGSVDSERHRVTARFNELRGVDGGGQVEFVTFHQNYAYEDFIEGIRPVLDEGQGALRYELRDGIFKKIVKRAKDEPDKCYVFVIDEINRGNIAKIFGELITLIEPSKRIGNDDAAQATLPYSQESFGVPKNLYLIGTMNTADRGITELDVALRRRFEFVRRMPKADHDGISEDIDGVDGRALLRAINGRIVEIKDRDHQIGHTYFIGVGTMEELKGAFLAQVIPLLEEYFYDDWEKILRVLNNNGFVTKRDGAEAPVFDLLPPDDSQWLQAKSYQAIYLSTSSASGPEG